MLPTTNRPSGSRAALVYTILIIVVLAVFAFTLTTFLSRSLEKRTEEELTQKTVLLVNTISSYHAALSENAISLANVFQSYFPAPFLRDPSRSISIENQKTPLLKNGSTTLNLNNSIVDRFTAVSKAVATVFVRSGDDFVRVSTSLKMENGSRAVGTFLERNHPAYQGLLQGTGYVGKAELYGKDYMTSYQPIKDSGNNVIAVLFIGLDFTDNLRELKEKIRGIKVGKSGYIFALDAKTGKDYGKIQIHPSKEGGNLVDSKTVEGAITREMLEKKDGIIRYPWINKELGETKTREKLVAYRTLKEWNWVICAGSWMDELNDEAKTLQNAMMLATTIVTLILVLLFRAMLRMEKRLTGELQLRVDEYQDSQEELQATEEMLRTQVDEYISTHDQLLASEEQLKIQLGLIEESSHKFQAVFEHSPITVALTTIPDGILYDVNQAFVDMFGYSREEAVGKTTVELSLWQVEEERGSYLQKLKDNRYTHNFEARMRRRGGQEITVLLSGALLEIAGTTFVLNAVMDVTEQKQLQNQLYQSQKMDVVGQLAGGIAHDFNNMLTVIMATAEMLKMRLSSDDKNCKMVNTIIEATNRSADLTRELLTFSRKGVTVSTPIRIHDTMSAVKGLLERTIDKKIQLEIRLEAGNPVVLGDQTQLQNALLNLGVNARDAMPQGGTLTYSTALKTLDTDACRSMGIDLPPGHYLQIAVTDTGAGMTTAVLEHIFEPFFTTKGIGKGTGLGLAAVYGTVKNHGGDIWVQSQAGTGSVFKIFLPLIADDTNKQTLKEEIVTGSGGILLVDDEEMLRTVGRDLLEELGYTVYLAENGQEALEVFAAHRDKLSLVMLDMIMPKMGGTETFLHLREQAPELKVLFCSGFSHDDTGDELIGLGARGFIHKPYNRSALSRAVAEALG